MRTLFFVALSLLWLVGFVETAAGASVQQPPDSDTMQVYVTHQIRFAPFCFATDEFPACDFDDPEAVKGLVGPYTIACSFYDPKGNPVTSAEKPGRYAAVVEIKRTGGFTSKRFVTLFRLPDGAAPAEAAEGEPAYVQPALLEAAGIDKEIIDARADELRGPGSRRMGGPRRDASSPAAATRRETAEAAALAVLCDLTAMKAAGEALPDENLSRLERQWWVDFKRHYYGYDKMDIYTTEFVCPTAIEGEPARVLREGTPAEAGMADNCVATIDAACQQWADDINTGFSLCVARHGVVVLNRGYGKRGGRGPDVDAPFTPETAGPLASTTKFLSSILFREFVDQGLIGLDEPVGVYAPALRDIQPKTVGRPLTFRDCYTHLGGFNGQQWGDQLHDLEEVIADLYPTLAVGQKFKYEGISLALSGKVMEMVSGESIPRLYRKHLLDPLGCNDTDVEGTATGSLSTALDLAKIGQMMLNGGAYGDKRFFRPEVMEATMPIPGRDRFQPDMSLRWGVGLKMFDTDGLSDKAYGHPGASGSSLVIDPTYDLVIAMVRFTEGQDFPEFLKRKGAMYKVILDCIKD